MPEPEAPLRYKLRVFPDYAPSVLWFALGFVGYADAHLGADLTRQLRAWEAHFYANTDGLGEWNSGFSGEAFDAEGLRLCHLVAEELGDLLDVEYISNEDGVKNVLLHGAGYGTNPEARAAFEAMIVKDKRREEKMRAPGYSARYLFPEPNEGNPS
jgi:hypothetical protein